MAISLASFGLFVCSSSVLVPSFSCSGSYFVSGWLSALPPFMMSLSFILFSFEEILRGFSIYLWGIVFKDTVDTPFRLLELVMAYEIAAYHPNFMLVRGSKSFMVHGALKDFYSIDEIKDKINEALGPMSVDDDNERVVKLDVGEVVLRPTK